MTEEFAAYMNVYASMIEATSCTVAGMLSYSQSENQFKELVERKS